MLAKVLSFALLSLEAYPLEIEVDIANGLPAVNIVGLGDTAVKESRERVKSAIKNSGFSWPGERITISLSPSDIRKEGACFDLPIALGILAATGQINGERLQEYYVLGELSLDGRLRPARGALPISIAVAKTNSKNLLLPFENAKEAALVKEASVFALKTLAQTVEFLNNPAMLEPFNLDLKDIFREGFGYQLDFAEIKGQYAAKRALEVAVCGMHNILFIGPAGSGKTMLAKRIPTIMPDLTLEQALEVTKIHSVTGLVPAKDGIVSRRPFRSPHHTISDIALAGGGSLPQPGEISLAHRGVLFLDELPEFQRNCLEVLRQPLEDGYIVISRIIKSFSFPASFMLVCAMNPCPCGYYSDPKRACRCSPNKIQNYMAKISGPLLDRIDIQIEIPPLKYKELSQEQEGETSQQIKQRVENTQRIQKERFKNDGLCYNAQMNNRLSKKYCALDGEAKELLRLAMQELGFSARAYGKILKVGRTIADLAGSELILAKHISEAIQYRSLDRNF